MRGLAGKGALRLAEGGQRGHVIFVRLPKEVRGVRARKDIPGGAERVTASTRCLDHIIPRARKGRNGYRNLVSSCTECNSRKSGQRAEDFLRWQYRNGRLESGELKERLRALEKMVAGKMRPVVDGEKN